MNYLWKEVEVEPEGFMMVPEGFKGVQIVQGKAVAWFPPGRHRLKFQKMKDFQCWILPGAYPFRWGTAEPLNYQGISLLSHGYLYAEVSSFEQWFSCLKKEGWKEITQVENYLLFKILQTMQACLDQVPQTVDSWDKLKKWLTEYCQEALTNLFIPLGLKLIKVDLVVLQPKEKVPFPEKEGVLEKQAHCSHCQKEVPAGKFCPYCGKPLQPHRCPSCQGEILPDGKFCPHCGVVLKSLP